MKSGFPFWVLPLVVTVLIGGFLAGRSGRASERSSDPPAPPPPAPMPGEDPGLEDLIRAGKKIEAIKYFRERHGCGLKEAKDAVEALERALGG